MSVTRGMHMDKLVGLTTSYTALYSYAHMDKLVGLTTSYTVLVFL